jgi:monofunctional glycosyltransferase
MKRRRAFLALLLIAFLALQLYFVARILCMRWVDPESTAFQRSETWRLYVASPVAQAAPKKKTPVWKQQWVNADQISVHLKRAVLVSEDDGFATHNGFDWDALTKAWQKNAVETQKLEKLSERQSAAKARSNALNADKPKASANTRAPKIVGGSTITQQLAKNLFLSGERSMLRKSQELFITLALEALLSKQRILEIYLNSVEWGEGVFGAEAAARHYFGKSAKQLTEYEAAKLAVMLPRPKYFETRPQSGYVADRTEVVVGRMPGARLP